MPLLFAETEGQHSALAQGLEHLWYKGLLLPCNHSRFVGLQYRALQMHVSLPLHLRKFKGQLAFSYSRWSHSTRPLTQMHLPVASLNVKTSRSLGPRFEVENPEKIAEI